jgi:hypothetical protein
MIHRIHFHIRIPIPRTRAPRTPTRHIRVRRCKSPARIVPLVRIIPRHRVPVIRRKLHPVIRRRRLLRREQLPAIRRQPRVRRRPHTVLRYQSSSRKVPLLFQRGQVATQFQDPSRLEKRRSRCSIVADVRVSNKLFIRDRGIFTPQKLSTDLSRHKAQAKVGMPTQISQLFRSSPNRFFCRINFTVFASRMGSCHILQFCNSLAARGRTGWNRSDRSPAGRDRHCPPESSGQTTLPAPAAQQPKRLKT